MSDKLLFAVGAVAGLALAACLLLYLLYGGTKTALNAERAAHNATRREYARDKAAWIADQRSANATIRGLQGEAGALLLNRDADRQAEFERFHLFMTGLKAPEGQPHEEADDTDKAAVLHLNRAFGRAGGLRLHGTGE